MKTNHIIDEARLGIMLNDLRLPTIKTLWPPSRPIVKDGQRPASSRPLPNMNWPNGPIAGSNVTSPRRICRRERRSTASLSTPYL